MFKIMYKMKKAVETIPTAFWAYTDISLRVSIASMEQEGNLSRQGRRCYYHHLQVLK